MKKFIALIGVLLIFILPVYSQSITIGIKAGWTDSFLKLHLKNPNLSYTFNGLAPNEFFPGITSGIQGNISLKNSISLETEILFPHTTKKPISTLAYAENYVQFPQMVRYNLLFKKKSHNSVYAEAGSYFGFLLVKTPFVYIGGPDRFDWGACGGIGFLHAFKNGTLDFNSRYQRSIFSLVPKRTLEFPHPSEQGIPYDISAYNRGFSFTVGYSFYLKYLESWFQKDKHRKGVR